MTRAAFNGGDFGIWDQLQKVTGLHAEVLYALMAGDMIGNLAEGLWEFSRKELVLMP